MGVLGALAIIFTVIILYMEVRREKENEKNPAQPEPDARSLLIEMDDLPDVIVLHHGQKGHWLSFKNKAVSKTDIQKTVAFLHVHSIEFEVHDLIYPREDQSTIDSGSYMTYSPLKDSQGKFLMTYGNNGWSGGIYEIEFDTIVTQLHHLITSKGVSETSRNPVFFKHYERKSVYENAKINREIREKHSV